MSNTIYTDVKAIKFHYTYLITELNTNKKYIGVRSSDVAPSEDLGIKYFSSSSNDEFKRNQKNNPLNYKYEVLNIFNDRKSANEEEIRLHTLYSVDKREDFINLVVSNSTGFNPVDYITVKDNAGLICSMKIDDPRYLSGEFVGLAKGMIVVKDKLGKTYQVSVNDPRYLSGELVATLKDMVMVKDNKGNIYQVSINDHRFLSGEFVGINKNMAVVIDNLGNKFKVSVDDPRYLSGEFVGHTKGYSTYKDANGNKVYTHKNDIRVKSGELVGLYAGLVNVKDNLGNRFKVSIDDPRYLSGELVNVLVKYKISINGKIYPSIKFASNSLSIGVNVIKNRIKKEEYKDWFTIPY